MVFELGMRSAKDKPMTKKEREEKRRKRKEKHLKKQANVALIYFCLKEVYFMKALRKKNVKKKKKHQEKIGKQDKKNSCDLFEKCGSLLAERKELIRMVKTRKSELNDIQAK